MKKVILSLFLFLASITLIGCTRDSKIQIGILQYVTHEDLDDARVGFIDSLKEDGFIDNENIKIQVLNPQADNTQMQMHVTELVRKSDLIFAIATPAAVAVSNEIKNQGKDIPMLFTAVTDPVDAKLVPSLSNHGSNVSGTSDITPIKEQISLVKELVPSATKIGVLYTSSETNSKIQADIAKKEIELLGLTAVVRTFSTPAELPNVFNPLAKEVDVIFIPSDNIISSNMGMINELSINQNIPIIASTTFQVKVGAAITLGLNYKNLGVQTGKMATKILNGQDIKTLDVETINELELAINLKTLKLLGINVSEDLSNKSDFIFE